MEIIGWCIGYTGVGMIVIAGLWLLVLAFQEDIGWGVACLLIPLVSLVFAIFHWDRASRPAAVWIAGFMCALLGKLIRDGTIFGS